MKKKLKRFIKNWVMAFLYPRPLIGLLYLPRFFVHWFRYKNTASSEKNSVLDMQPCLGDWISHTPFDAHYFYQGAWLARRLASKNISKHVDIGSSVLTMSVLSAQVEIIFVDYRPLKTDLSGLTSIAGDILDLPFEENSVESLSCLHVIEHIGLGRYGDPINPSGSIEAAIELQRIIKQGGSLYLSLPVGRERVCFNAHRVHAPATIIELFSQMSLIEFSFVNDAGEFCEHKEIDEANELEYGCGLFHFQKLS
ncbi:MAG: DUF268 domain-containing protein [Methylococcales bacterium]